jgi:pyrroline-5-carboxylate reductase
MSLNKRIGFMGAGQMAEALARGLIDKGVVQASQICCSDPAAARKELFRSLGVTPYDTNLEVTLLPGNSAAAGLTLPLAQAAEHVSPVGLPV